MSRFSARYYATGLLLLLVAVPSWCQKGGSGGKGGSGSGSTGSGSSGTGSSPTSPISNPSTQPSDVNQQTYQSPMYVRGRILMDGRQPVPEPVSVALRCGIRQVQVIHSDLKGYFEFSLGTGAQSDTDFSASNDAPISPGGTQSSIPGASRSLGNNNALAGCEVEVSLSGYQPMSRNITDRTDISGIDVGTLQLARIAGVTGSSISVTSLQVPNGARKEFEKGDKDARSNHPDSATQHLEKAVAQYDKYAAAWDELGNLYSGSKATDKARAAYQKAIDADPHYIPPYLGLAGLELQNNEFQPAVDTAGKALELDSSIVFANYVQALGNFDLNRFDAAEKSAQMAEKVPHQNIPDLHALHASILLQKKDYAGAAAQMRAYLKEFPQGRFADQMKTNLQQIENAQGGAGSQTASVEAQIAP